MLQKLSNMDLVRRVLLGQPSETEAELAKRLTAAVEEIERLVRELRIQIAKEVRGDAGG